MKTLQNDKENSFQRSKMKKNTYQNKNENFNINNFEKIQKSKKPRFYSTKLIVSFVPRLKPKKSFCKPTFFQLNEKERNNKNEKKSFELEKISSCDELEEDVPSSEIESDEEEQKNNYEKEEKEDQSNFLLNKNKPNIENKVYKEDILSSFKESSEDEDNSSSEEYKNLRFKEDKNDKKESVLKNLRKEMTKIKSNSVVNKSKELNDTLPKNLKSVFNLDENDKNDFLNEDNKTQMENSNKNSINENANKLFSDKYISILEILSFKNKKN